MSEKGRIAFIIEGPKKEYQIIKNITNKFFHKSKIEFIPIPARQNIYMLWNTLKEDDFETDIMEVIKEYYKQENRETFDWDSSCFQEIYLFFDYDGHQTNLPSDCDPIVVINEMLKTFDNETELGKLYLSYPMVEALKDIKGDGSCAAFTNCVLPIPQVARYKKLTGENISFNQLSRYDNEWNDILPVFVSRIQCLLHQEKLSFPDYRNMVTVNSIFDAQFQKYIQPNNEIFILSAFPEFLLDYYREEFWNEYIDSKRIALDDCFNN